MLPLFIPAQFYVKLNTVCRVAQAASESANSMKMKAIMGLDLNVGIRQIVSFPLIKST